MEQVIGSVDDRGRPVVRVEGTLDSVLVVVDTGFNGDLIVTRAAAQALGIGKLGHQTVVELGDGSVGIVYQTNTTIPWIGGPRQIRVLVSDSWQPMGDNPAGLLGTSLMAPHRLLVDFEARTVEIEVVVV